MTMNKLLITKKDIHEAIIFFDAECVMCSNFANLMLKIDKKGLIFLAPLQGETAKKMAIILPKKPENWSIFYVENNNYYQQSDAVIYLCRRLGGSWYLLSLIIGIIPRKMRDFIYRIIAINRYKTFGKCDLYSQVNKTEKNRFLP